MKNIFRYETSSPSCLYRLDGQHKGNAGSQTKRGYWRVFAKGKIRAVHQIIWGTSLRRNT